MKDDQERLSACVVLSVTNSKPVIIASMGRHRTWRGLGSRTILKYVLET